MVGIPEEFYVAYGIGITVNCWGGSEVTFRSLYTYPNLEAQDGSGEHLAALGPQCCAFRERAYSWNSDTILLAPEGE